MRKYKRLTYTDRLKIESLYNSGVSCRAIAHTLGYTPSTICNEIKKALYPHMGAELSKRPYHYSATIGQQKADYARTACCMDIKLSNHYDYAAFVAREIKRGVSVDVIVNTLKKHGNWTVSTTTLYRYIDRGYIPNISNSDLPEKKRPKKRKSKRVASRPPAGTSIERRPAYINDRTTFGHWELDSIIGRAKGDRESFLVLTERSTRYQVIIRSKSRTAANTVKALDTLLSKYPKRTFQSITVDNGSEFSDCYGMEHDKKGMKRLTVYYCHPFCSCERGSNERANRIIRRYFPKGKSLKKYTQKDCDRVAHIMNSTPRKILNYDTPADLFNRQLALLSTDTI